MAPASTPEVATGKAVMEGEIPACSGRAGAPADGVGRPSAAGVVGATGATGGGGGGLLVCRVGNGSGLDTVVGRVETGGTTGGGGAEGVT